MNELLIIHTYIHTYIHLVNNQNKQTNTHTLLEEQCNMYYLHVHHFYHLIMLSMYALLYLLLAHLSRRLIGELIVYEGIHRPSVRPSVNIFKRHLL